MSQLNATTHSNAFDPVAAAETAAPVLRRWSAQADLERRVAPEAIAAMSQAGLARILTPKAYGGLELSVSEQIRACMATGRACSAASWVNMVCAAHTYVVARFPQHGRDEVFAGQPDVLIPGALAPQGEITAAAGGAGV